MESLKTLYGIVHVLAVGLHTVASAIPWPRIKIPEVSAFVPRRFRKSSAARRENRVQSASGPVASVAAQMLLLRGLRPRGRRPQADPGKGGGLGE